MSPHNGSYRMAACRIPRRIEKRRLIAAKINKTAWIVVPRRSGALPDLVWHLTGAVLLARDAGEGVGETGRSRNVPVVRYFAD